MLNQVTQSLSVTIYLSHIRNSINKKLLNQHEILLFIQFNN
jgi:hypothetical protein